MKRTPEIIRAMRRILAECDGHPLPEDTLHEHLNMRLRPAVTSAELALAIGHALNAGHIASMKGEDGDPLPRWLITERGQAAMLQH